MSTSGAWEASYPVRPNFHLKLTIQRVAVSGNSSQYQWDLRAIHTPGTYSGTFDTNPGKPWSLTIGPNSWSGDKPLDFRNGNPDNILGGGFTSFFGHDANGDLNFGYSVSHNAGGSFGTAALSGTFTADRLASVPPAPTALAVSSATTSSLHFSYSSNGDGGSAMVRWEWQYASTPDFAGAGTNSSGIGDVDATGLNPRSTYYFRARGVNGVGTGSWSNVISGSTLGPVPTVPTGYGVSDLASTTAYTTMPNVADNGGTALSDIRVEINTAANSTGSVIANAGTYRQILLVGLSAGTSYWFRLAVANSTGWSDWGAWVNFTTKSNVPTPPQSVAVTSITDSTASVTWAAPANLLGSTLISYTVRLAKDQTFATALQTQVVAADQISSAFSGLTAGTTYYAQVWANSNNGFGSYSSPVSFTTTGTSPFSGLWLRTGGVWRNGLLWIRVAGIWRTAVLWERVGGVWRRK